MRTEPEQNMAKVQKSLLINEDLVRLVDELQKRTGANFTRIMTASLLQYLFSCPQGPDPIWMSHAVELENGETEVGDMPAERANVECAYALWVKQSYKDRESMMPSHVEGKADMSRRNWPDWEKMTKGPSDDKLKNIIDFWKGPWGFETPEEIAKKPTLSDLMNNEKQPE